MQTDILKKIDVLVEMAGATMNIDTLKAEKKVIEEEASELRDRLASLSEFREDEKYFRASEKQVDENIKVSLEAKIKKQEKSIKKLQKQIDSIIEEESTLHNNISSLKEKIRLSNEYIEILNNRLVTVTTSSTKDYYRTLLHEEEEKVSQLVLDLGKLEEEYSGTGGALERLNYLNLAMEEMNRRLESEKLKLVETKANLVNPSSYLDEDLKEHDEAQIKELQQKISDLDKRKLEIITDPTMIASEAKEAIITGNPSYAIQKVQELVTIVKSKPYMDMPSTGELSTMLQEEEEAAIEARDEFASLIDAKDYLGNDSKVVEERIDYLNIEIASLEDKIRIANEEIKNIDTVEFQALNERLSSTMEIYNQLIEELTEYKVVLETDNEDKTPKRRAILAAAYDRKQKEVENVQIIINNYKEDQKKLIQKAYVLETERIKEYEDEITLHREEITAMNCILANLGKTKDVLAIENDKQKLKDLDSVVKNIKHRQKYNQTPGEIYDEIELYLGNMDRYTPNLNSSDEVPVLEEVAPVLEEPVIADTIFEANDEVSEQDVMEELPSDDMLSTTDSIDSLEEATESNNTYIIGDYKEDELDTEVPINSEAE